MNVSIDRFRDLSHKAQVGIVSTGLVLAGLVPAIMPSIVAAAPALTERELQSSSAIVAQATTLTWVFDTTADAGNVDHIEIEFCDSPLGACTTPNGTAYNSAADNIPGLPGSPTATLAGPGGWAAPANSATRVAGDAGGTANQILIDVTTPFSGASANEASIQIAGFTNDDTANKTFYTRMRVYSDTGSTLEWEGVFAQSTSQTLTVNARVQERLDFCVGATAVDDATTSVGAACSNISGTSVDIGNIESGFTNVSPVTATNGGSNTNGVAMVRTNAVNGVVVDYKALQETSSGKLKVASATCSGVSVTDQCFNSTGTTQVAIASGTENFGMTVAGVNCGSASGAYTCDFSTGTYNLLRDNNYDGDVAGQNNNTYVSDGDQESGTTTFEYAWDDSGTADRIASSAASSVKVVDDEALILKFAATAGITTPTGAYSVQADFIATATF